ncbi:hypothetical protein BH24GEM3_BH24GEM3_04180 [soil metagenome]
MPCLIVLLALLGPRLLILFLWFFTDWFAGIFDTLLWPILGLIFAPTTLLWYSAVVNWFGGEWTLVPIIGIVIALLIDFSPAEGGRRRYA